MKKYVCPDCGQKFQEDSVPSECPNCGCSSQLFVVEGEQQKTVETSQKTADVSYKVLPILEASNDFAAEKLGAVIANVMKVLGIIICVASFLVGLIVGAKSYYDGWTLFLIIFGGGLLLGFLFILCWAWLRLLVNISYRLTRLDNKTKAE